MEVNTDVECYKVAFRNKKVAVLKIFATGKHNDEYIRGVMLYLEVEKESKLDGRFCAVMAVLRLE